GAGNIFGRNSWFEVEDTRHHPNIFVGVVGRPGVGRKGTSQARINRPLALAASDWMQVHKDGNESGEGIIPLYRDPRESDDEDDDLGASDTRLFIIESELSMILKIMSRTGSSISPVLRKCWDGGVLRSTSKSRPCVASNAHVSVIGHITPDELRRNLTETEL